MIRGCYGFGSLGFFEGSFCKLIKRPFLYCMYDYSYYCNFTTFLIHDVGVVYFMNLIGTRLLSICDCGIIKNVGDYNNFKSHIKMNFSFLAA